MPPQSLIPAASSSAMLVGREVRRRLHVHRRRRASGARSRSCAPCRIASGSGASAIAISGLRAEVLDDHFLDVAVALVQIADREQAVDALGRRLADADQDAGGERDRAARRPRAIMRRRDRRILVGRPLMDSAAGAQPRRDALEHQPHADVHGRSRAISSRRQDAGVGVRQEPVLERDLAGARDVVAVSRARARRASRDMPGTRAPACRRGTSAPRAAERAAAARPLRDLVRGHRPCAGIAGILPERAVGAAVAAEIGDRQKDLREYVTTRPLARSRSAARRRQQRGQSAAGHSIARLRRPRPGARRRAPGQGFRVFAGIRSAPQPMRAARWPLLRSL